MKNQDFSKKRVIVPLIIVVLVTLILGFTLAYFNMTVKDKEIVKTADFSYRATRKYTASQNWMPGDSDNPVLTLTNTGDTNIVIRASITETWEDSNQNQLSNTYSGNEVALKTIGANWIKIGNYYYYNAELAKNQTTQTSLITEVTFNPLVNNVDYSNASYEINVGYEILQASVIEDVWETTIADINETYLRVLYNRMKSQAVSDTTSSTYVQNQNGIEFNHISSDTNGKGIYDFGNGIYYYRGAVDNNNVLFDNKCWQIIRTTASGTVKMIYNGTPSSGTCPTHRGNAANVAKRVFNSSYYQVDYAKYRTSAMKTYIEGTFLPTISAAAQAKLAQTTFYLEGDTITPASGTFSGTARQSYAPANRIWGFSNTKGAWSNATANSQVEAMTKSKLYIDRGNDTYNALVGLIQADEVILAGGRGQGDSNNTGANTSYYLHSGVWYWTISPWGFHSGVYAAVVGVTSDGYVSASYVFNSGGGVRPVVSLKSGARISSGDGSVATPYQIDLSS